MPDDIRELMDKLASAIASASALYVKDGSICASDLERIYNAFQALQRRLKERGEPLFLDEENVK